MAVHADKLRWLFWLRWKTLLRGYSRRPLSIVGSVFVLLFIILVGGTIAVSSFFAYRLLPASCQLRGLIPGTDSRNVAMDCVAPVRVHCQ